MAKTQISKTPNGWIDNDNPTVFHPSREAAREARRKSLYYQGKTAHLRSLKVNHGLMSQSWVRSSAGLPATQTTGTPSTSTNSIDTVKVTNVTVDLFTGLEQRLFDRLTQRQGVSQTEATSVIKSNGYNKAASYGHMRAAGAGHFEALFVINLDNPDVSLAYGIARANGDDHTTALREALVGDNDD